MSPSLLALPASAALLALLAAQAPLQASHPTVRATLDHFAQITAMDPAEPVAASSRSTHHADGLGKASLQTATLQPALGLETEASALLSQETWRLIFPKRTAP